MAASALKKITTEAKKIYKRGGTWKAAIKKAGVKYRKTKKAHPKKRRKVSGTLSDSKRPAGYAIGRIKRRRKVSGTLSDSPRPSGNSIGGLTTAQHIAHAKKKIAEEIARWELLKFKATKKSIKNRMTKHISELKSKYRKLC